MAATQLSLYNGALRICRHRRMAALSDTGEARRLLDDVWGDGSTTGAVKHCLQMGQWTWATRSGAIAYDTGIDPDFGHPYAFEQPSDVVRVMAVCEDEFFTSPLLHYVDERGYWYASLQTIYVKYVSNGATYGTDYSLWPESFTKLVEAYMANEIAGALTGVSDTLIKLVEERFIKAKKNALSLDGTNGPTRFAPEGSWSRSRRGAGSGSRWNETFS